MGLLIEPVDIGKYEFVRMKQREEWGVLVREDSPFAAQDAIRPGDLVGIPVVTTMNSPVHKELAIWSSDYAKEMDSVMTYNLLYNAAVVARKGIGPVICLKLACHYDDLVFIPLSPTLKLGSVLAWKEHQTFSNTVSAFIQFAKKYEKSISNNEN